jgi:microcompartment protein CcmK/EutM
MQLARVIGDVVATIKDPSFDGIKLLLVSRSHRTARMSAAAGGGRLRRRRRRRDGILRSGKEASFPWHPLEVPAEAGIVGIVDHSVTDSHRLDTDDPRARGWHRRFDDEAAAVRGREAAAGAARDAAGRGEGPTLLAIDSVGAGVSERVLVVLEGRAAGEALGKKLSPVDAAIIGIVDQLECVE